MRVEEVILHDGTHIVYVRQSKKKGKYIRVTKNSVKKIRRKK